MSSGRRTSARLSSSQNSQPNGSHERSDSSTAAAGQKRKADSSTASRPKKGKTGEQQTLEDTLPNQSKDEVVKGEDAVDDQDMNDALDDAEAEQDQKAAKQEQKGDVKDKQTNGSSESNGTNGHDESSRTEKAAKTNGHSKEDDEQTKTEDNTDQQNGADKKASSSNAKKDDSGNTTSMDDTGKLEKNKKNTNSTTETEAGAVEVSKEREQAMPSNILEKGIIYFFVRGRVGVDSPDSVQDLARSYMVLRPLPEGAKLGEGAVGEMKNARLLALPKKVLPKSGRDKFMTFVEKAGITIKELKEDFMQGSEYDTKTTGTRQAPPVTPVGEGVYAITTQGRDSHLAYMLTIPETPGEVQNDMGLADKGSFVLSVKNPESSGPANTNLPQGPDWPKEVQEEFRGLRWMPLQPKHLDYPNCQLLLIGEKAGELGKAGDPTEKEAKDSSKETPAEALEELEHEDEQRAEALGEDNAVFEDLKISHGEYPKLQTTW